MREGLNTLATGFKALRCPQEKTLRGNLSKWFGGATMAINCIGKDGKAKVDYSKDINIVKSRVTEAGTGHEQPGANNHPAPHFEWQFVCMWCKEALWVEQWVHRHLICDKPSEQKDEERGGEGLPDANGGIN